MLPALSLRLAQLLMDFVSQLDFPYLQLAQLAPGRRLLQHFRGLPFGEPRRALAVVPGRRSGLPPREDGSLVLAVIFRSFPVIGKPGRTSY